MSKVLLTHIREIMTLQGASSKKARGPLGEADLSVQKKQAMVLDGDRILWVGSQNKIPRDHRVIRVAHEVHSNVFPGFIDAHTHSLFAGDRTSEFEMRVQGQTYQQIAQRGGGIQSTVRHTRSASLQKLKQGLQQRMLNFLAQGVTTVEVKTGYGLLAQEELRLLKILKSTSTPVRLMTTFLGAHALSPEFSSRTEYLESLREVLPKIIKQKLSHRIDIFVEENYFSVDEARGFLKEAKRLGFDLCIHADQLSRTGASLLALELDARSADHMICLTESDIHKVASSELTCVLLPTADFYLRCAYPPARSLIDRGARVALATDFNPGTSPTQNIQWVGLLARQEMRMTLPEVFCAFTLGGAYALGLEQSCGVLAPGWSADFFITDQTWDRFFYDLSSVPLHSVWSRGRRHKV